MWMEETYLKTVDNLAILNIKSPNQTFPVPILLYAFVNSLWEIMSLYLNTIYFTKNWKLKIKDNNF